MPMLLNTPSLYNLGSTVTTNTWTTLQDISTPSGAAPATVPANQITTTGQTLVLRASGVWSCTSTPTFGLGFYFGGTGGVALAATAATALTTGAGGLSNMPWVMEWWGTCSGIGSSTSIIGGGYVFWNTSATATTVFPFGTPQTAATINTLLEKTLVVGGVCSASSASNQIILQQYSIAILS